MTTKIYEICVIGSGPAAYTALQYLKDFDLVHFEGSFVGDNGPGGQLTTTTNVDNYPGFPNGIQGPDLIANMQKQFTGEVVSENVVSVVKVNNNKSLDSESKKKDNECTSNKLENGKNKLNPEISQETFDAVNEGINQTAENEKQDAQEEVVDNKTTRENANHMQNDKKLDADLTSFVCDNTKKHKKDVQKDIFEVKTEDNNVFHAYCVLVCTGAQAKRLYVPGTNDNEFWQKGVSSCAVCDGWVYKDKRVIVIGGGDSAMEEASYLSNIASEVILVHRSYNFKARKDMLQRVQSNKKISVKIPFELECVRGTKHMEQAYFRNVETKEIEKIDADGLFFGIGHIPNTSFLGSSFAKDADGYLITDKNGKTSVEGVFACGDVQDKKYKQAVTAAGSGCLAALSAIEYLKSNKKSL